MIKQRQTHFRRHQALPDYTMPPISRPNAGKNTSNVDYRIRFHLQNKKTKQKYFYYPNRGNGSIGFVGLRTAGVNGGANRCLPIVEQADVWSSDLIMAGQNRA
ncbi:hypothetical protein I3760_13G145100 [Carya illinoinensis]|nr:hypothetical protein I3760_13G145100 [Carya illinoinensis]